MSSIFVSESGNTRFVIRMDDRRNMTVEAAFFGDQAHHQAEIRRAELVLCDRLATLHTQLAETNAASTATGDLKYKIGDYQVESLKNLLSQCDNAIITLDNARKRG